MADRIVVFLNTHYDFYCFMFGNCGQLNINLFALLVTEEDVIEDGLFGSDYFLLVINGLLCFFFM